MFSNKIKITLILAIIFLVSVVSVTQAAPPLQGRSGTSQGHTLDLDAEGNNLGTVMKNNNAEDGTSDNDGQNHVAAALANYFDEMSYEDIMALHESGVGFGNIARALFFTAKFDLGKGAADLLAEAGQSGWGKTLRDNGIHPGSIGKGKGNQPEHAGAKANNGQSNGNGKGNNGQGNGNGKNKDDSGDDDADTDVDADDNDDDDDNGNGNGRGKGKDKGNNGQGKGKNKNNATDLDDDDDADSDDDASNSNGRGKSNGNNGKGNGKGKGNGNNGNNGQNSSEGN